MGRSAHASNCQTVYPDPSLNRAVGGFSLSTVAVLAACSTALAKPTTAGPGVRGWPGGVAVVGYASEGALAAALGRYPARVVRRVPALKVVEVRPAMSLSAYAGRLSRAPGIRYVEQRAERRSFDEPALALNELPGGNYEWQFAATHENLVPPSVLRAASQVTIAVVDTGADVSAPDIAAKAPETHSVIDGGADVRDVNGHGTFVAALACGAVDNGDGIAGFGGDAKLLIVQASRTTGSFSDVDEAAAILYAVDHGAKIINLSLGGPATSTTERNAVAYATSHGALLVAAVGNEYDSGSPVEYPAALLQPIGSNGVGGTGLSVGASDLTGRRASFSSAGSTISLAAPGVNVFSALSSTAAAGTVYHGVALPGSAAGLYAFASGTSFAAPQVAGAAALVWAANPSLSAQDVAEVLKRTASGGGSWTPDVGFGVMDVAAAVNRALSGNVAAPVVHLTGKRVGRRVDLNWTGTGAAAYRLSVREDGGQPRVLLASTTQTSAGYALTLGHTYAFRVAAIDATGRQAATSDPFTVALMRTSVTLLLQASVTSGSHPLRVTVTALLRPRIAAQPATGRTVVLESLDEGGWSEVARTRTGADGAAVWLVTLEPGRFHVRARFYGNDELSPALSKPLAFRVAA